MSTPAWSKGEWYILGEDTGSDGIPFIEICKGEIPSREHKSIAYVQSTIDADYENWGFTDEDRANAHLITQSKNLYAALFALLGGDDNLHMAIGGNPIYVDAFLAKARATLAKARGEISQ